MTTIVACNKACQNLTKTMDDIVAGRLVECPYQDDKAVWVRKPNEPGECTAVPIPKNRLRMK